MQISESFVLKIIEKFSAGKIGELELDDGTSRLVLKKPPSGGAFLPGTAASANEASGAMPGGAPGTSGAMTGGMAWGAPGLSGATPGDAAESGGRSNADTITSPIVGTFYPALSPDAPPLVRPGSKVKAGDTLCILEAMKMMNHLEAEFDCEILAVKAASGDLVEYGQALFEVKRL
jgi:acetyl-CoA carboxylase biotin carboxyl carrier protein